MKHWLSIYTASKMCWLSFLFSCNQAGDIHNDDDDDDDDDVHSAFFWRYQVTTTHHFTI